MLWPFLLDSFTDSFYRVVVKKCWAGAVRASPCPVSYAGPQNESRRDSGEASSWCGGSLFFFFFLLAQLTRESSLHGLSVHVYSAQYRLFFFFLSPLRPWYRLALSPSHAPSVRLIMLSPPCLSWLTEIESTHGWNHLFFFFSGQVRMISSVPPAVSSWLNQTAATAGDSSWWCSPQTHMNTWGRLVPAPDNLVHSRRYSQVFHLSDYQEPLA